MNRWLLLACLVGCFGVVSDCLFIYKFEIPFVFEILRFVLFLWRCFGCGMLLSEQQQPETGDILGILGQLRFRPILGAESNKYFLVGRGLFGQEKMHLKDMKLWRIIHHSLRFPACRWKSTKFCLSTWQNNQKLPMILVFEKVRLVFEIFILKFENILFDTRNFCTFSLEKKA